MNVMTRVYPSSAEDAKSHWDRHFATLEATPLRYRAGGRCATLRMSLEAFGRRMGNPHSSAPRTPDGEGGVDGAGKVTAEWFFETPRGPVSVHDYWWNGPEELSVGAADVRAMRWFQRWAEQLGLPFCDSVRVMSQG